MWRAREQVDDIAARLLGEERRRHAAAVERLLPNDADAIVVAMNRHLERVHEILAAFARRRSRRATPVNACQIC